MKFAYKAKTKEGELKSGEIEAFSKEAAITLLQKQGLFPIFVEEIIYPFWAKEIAFGQKISSKDLVIVFRQLATLFRAGIPFIEALNTIVEETKNRKIAQIFSRIVKEVEGGATFSDALSLYPDVFSSFVIYMIKSGEISGNLAQTLEVLADTLERNYLFANKVKDALLYPGFIVTTAIIVLLGMVFFVLPNLAAQLTQFEFQPPPLLHFFLNLGNFLKSWGIFILFLLFLSIFSIFWYFKTREGKEKMGHYLISLPLFGEVFKMIYLARFAENFGVLLGRGIPVAESLEICADLVGNPVYREAILVVRDGVKSGEQIATPLDRFPELFPPFYTEMIKIGERSGNLSKSLSQVSNFYQKEVERTLSTFSTLLEPILIIIIGLVVGLLVFSVLNIIYQVVSSVGA